MAKYKKIPVTIEAYTFDEMKDLIFLLKNITY